MMHLNFYQWHTRVSLTPDANVLAARWNAAEAFAKTAGPQDVQSLIGLLIFSEADAQFIKRFTEAIVKAEMTFPQENNVEYLKLMAAAAIYSQFKESSELADAFALGLLSVNPRQIHVRPSNAEIFAGAGDYLITESERCRPEIEVGVVKKKIDSNFTALKAAADGGNVSDVGKATEALLKGVAAVVNESHQLIGDVIKRLAEENQFLWWLVGRRSSLLGKARSDLSASEYTLIAGIEASERVSRLPPAQSVGALIAEVLSQCRDANVSRQAKDFLPKEGVALSKMLPLEAFVSKLTPMLGLATNGDVLEKMGIPGDTLFSPEEMATQYFNELIFVRALKALG